MPSTDRLLLGGFLNRVLAKIVVSGAHFLVLDEPTNHMDCRSVEVVESSLMTLTAAWPGDILNHMVQYSQLDNGFGALSDPTRRGILERLGHGDASISDLAADFEMTLTGIKKHVRILEEARLVTTEKAGRVRICRLGPRRLEAETAWIATYRQMLEARLDRLGEFLDRTKGDSS